MTTVCTHYVSISVGDGGSCLDAGYTECCDGGNCIGSEPFDCFCDQFCYFLDDCCSDISSTCSQRTWKNLSPQLAIYSSVCT